MFPFKTNRSIRNGTTVYHYCYVFTLFVAIDFRHPFMECAILPSNNISLELINQSEPFEPSATTFSASLPSILAQKQQPNTDPFVQKYAISDLTRDLNLQLKSIFDHELLIPTIQSHFNGAFDSFERGPSSNEHNDTKILNTIATKIEAKLSHGIRVLNETVQKFLSIVAENTNDRMQTLLLDAIILPCTTNVAKQSERSANNNANVDIEFIGGINKRKAIEVLNFLKNAGHLHETDDRNFTINRRLMETLKAINLFAAPTNNVPIFHDVFFLPKHSQISSTNCQNTHPNEHHRFLYASSIVAKKILLIIDHGSTATISDSLDVTKSFAQIILNLLNDDDQLMIMGISNIIHTMDGPSKFITTNSTMKNSLRKFIDGLERDATATNHSLAFQYAFEWIASQSDSLQLDEKSTPVQILYVSLGLVSQPTDIKTVLETISVGQAKLKQPILINTCAIILDEKRGVEVREFLSDIAHRNYAKYGIHMNGNASNTWFNNLNTYNQKGNTFIVNHRNSNDMYAVATAAITDIWFEKPFIKSQIIVHQPFYDQSVKDQIIYITKSVQDYGIVGVSMYLSDMAEDLIYHFNQYSNSEPQLYGFLCDKNGFTIWHPTFSRPNIISYDTTYATDIKYFEKAPETIRQRWLNDETGIVQISKANLWNRKKSKVYRWRRLSDWYIVCLVHVLPQIEASESVLPKKAAAPESFHTYKIPLILSSNAHTNANAVFDNISVDAFPETETKLEFHRLDLVVLSKSSLNQPNSQSKLCQHCQHCQYFKQISIFDIATLYLSPRSFKSPFQHLTTMCDNNFNTNSQKDINTCRECLHRIENIMAYIKDTTNLLTNPGLQPHVRRDVHRLSPAIEMLRIQHQFRSKIEKYVIRRYITSMNGIILMYPGFPLPNDFDPSRRSWFRKTMENIGKLTITNPYLDLGGSGYIVTISHVIFEKGQPVDGSTSNEQQQQRQQQQRNIAAIVSIDVTLGFLYQVLLQSSDYCRKDENIKCFLIDEFGYLVVYPIYPKLQVSLFDSQFNLNEHITHRESLIANDILLHKTLVQKRMCQNLLNRKVERYYKFNTSLNGALMSNRVNGERTKYQIEAVSNTNLFVIMKNSSEGGAGAAFCPCSVVDKICFNCKRIELMNCECPCECSIEHLNTGSIISEYMYGDLLEDKNVSDKKISLFDSIDVCTQPSEEFIPNKKTNVQIDALNTLNQCVNFTCELYATQLDCLGILGCVWCEIDIDQTILLSPFCTHQSSCFGGALGSPNTPYGDGDIGFIIDSILPPTFTSTVGPIAIGAVVILFLVIGLAMYCYRNNLEPGAEHLYVESMAVEHNFGLPLSRLDYDTILPHNGLGNDTTDKRNNTGAISSDSPYRSNYFRRLPNGESDPGYSTMTPHDDSDHACFTLVEPLINNKCSNQSISDSASFNTEPPGLSLNYDLNSGKKSSDGYSSPLKSQCEQTSELKSMHHIHATVHEVQVHHPMEASLEALRV